MITAMHWSPDSECLAVAQSDNIVFVYKLGASWDDEKRICNKFGASSSVTCLAWPAMDELVYGCLDGKVRVGRISSNSTTALYKADSMAVAAAASPDGTAVVTGHGDGALYMYYVDEEGAGGTAHTRLTVHAAPIVALAWGAAIAVAGADRNVCIYSPEGSLERTFEYADDPAVRNITALAFNPPGESVVVGSWDRLGVLTYNARDDEWDDSNARDVPGLHSVTAMAWRQDGSRLIVGTLCGGVHAFDACLKRVRYKGTFEFTHVSSSQVIVKRLATGMRIVLRSSFGCEIDKINVFQDQFLVAHTQETLLLGDLVSCKLSEVPWTRAGGEKFYFDTAAAAAVYVAGELCLVEYGRNEILGTCRTEYPSPALLSLRINERPPVPGLDARGGSPDAGMPDNKKIAYMLDAQTIRVLDLVSNATIATISHDTRVDWMELNARCSLVLFRDRRHRLHLYDIVKQSRTTLLQFCSYAQWVPGSDVVVAQSRRTMMVWYNVATPDAVTTFDIRGEIEDIERGDGKTEVLVDEGVNTMTYMLDEGLIAFGTAMEDGDMGGAAAILEALPVSPETSGMWKQLASAALENNDLVVSQRAAAALGDVARARFLGQTLNVAMEAGSFGHWLVQARMAQLRGELRTAEAIMVDAGKVEDAIAMWRSMHRWDEALALAESRGHPRAPAMRTEYFNHLLSTGQEDRAAMLKEQDGDMLAAIDLYIKGGFPGKAWALVNPRPEAFPPQAIEAVLQALSRTGMHAKAGTLLERMNQPDKAMQAYEQGKDFRSAVELARRSFPARVVTLEKAWGDYLVSQKQVDAAINHYIEAGAAEAAIMAAMRSRQFSRAAQLVADTLHDPAAARPYWAQLARHYDEAGMLEEAERAYIRAGDGPSAVDMYLRSRRWEAAHRVANACMPGDAVARLFMDQAAQEAMAGNFSAAEALYLVVNQADAAITMYKKARRYDAMVRLVAAHRRAHLKDTHLHLARALVAEGDYKAAERHWVSAGSWESAVDMYRTAAAWDDAIRVAKANGGSSAAHRVAYAQAVALGGEAGSKLLNRLGLIEEAIDYACEIAKWTHAFELASKHRPGKVADVHLKKAMSMEDDGHFEEAEAEFVSADKPREAVEMWLHQKRWDAALRVAENYDPAFVPDVLVKHADACVEDGDLTRAETLYLDAKKPELAVEAHMNARAWPDAVRVAQRHLPHRVRDIKARVQRLMDKEADELEGSGRSPAVPVASPSGGAGGAAAGAQPRGTGGEGLPALLANARLWESQGDWNLALDTYLKIQPGIHGGSVEEVVDAWAHALTAAKQNAPRRFTEVAVELGRRLARLRRWEAAGDALAAGGAWKDAVDAYVAGQEWTKAKAAAKRGAPHLAEAVRKAEQQAATRSGDPDALLDADDVDGALRTWATQGNWERVWEVAAAQDTVTLARWAFPYLERVLKQGNYSDAVQKLSKYGAPAVASNIAVYSRLVRGLFQGPRARAQPMALLAQARQFMYKVVSDLRREAAGSPAQAEAERLLMALHFHTLQATAKQHNLAALVAQLAIAQLRFVGIVPADRAFLEAGTAAKAAGPQWEGVAFVMFNRMLDIADAVHESHGDVDIDNSDFAGLDVPPPDAWGPLPTPSQLWLSESEVEELRTFVLSKSMDTGHSAVIPPGAVPAAAAADAPRCVVTGYPVTPSEGIACPACGSPAIRAAWNALVSQTKTCPWCNAAASPAY